MFGTSTARAVVGKSGVPTVASGVPHLPLLAIGLCAAGPCSTFCEHIARLHCHCHSLIIQQCSAAANHSISSNHSIKTATDVSQRSLNDCERPQAEHLPLVPPAAHLLAPLARCGCSCHRLAILLLHLVRQAAKVDPLQQVVRDSPGLLRMISLQLLLKQKALTVPVALLLPLTDRRGRPSAASEALLAAESPASGPA